MTFQILQPGTGPMPGDHYLPAAVDTVMWGRLPCASDAPVLRIEPGDTREVTLTAYSGSRHLVGFNNLVDGGLDSRQTRIDSLARMTEGQFKDGKPTARTTGAAKKGKK